MTFGGQVVFSGELPDRDNRPNLSCIPADTYEVDWTYSPAFGRMMYLVRNVEGRSGIRIHPANYMGDKTKGLRTHLYGCIALSKKVGWMDGQKALILSRPAVTALERWGKKESFTLEIIDGIS